MHRTTLIAMLCLGLLIAGTAASAERLSGTVVNRDGDPQVNCKVVFRSGGEVKYEVRTNSEGVFYLDNPSHGEYDVKVEKGDESKEFSVKIDPRGLNPSTLVVDW